MSVMEQEPVRSRRSFTDEFKRDAVGLVIDEGRTVVDVARSLGINTGSTRASATCRPSSGNSYTVNTEKTKPRNQRDRPTGGVSAVPDTTSKLFRERSCLARRRPCATARPASRAAPFRADEP